MPSRRIVTVESRPSFDQEDPPELSIVVASVESAFSLEAALAALGRTCEGIRHEIFVMDASHDTSAQIAENHAACHYVSRHPPGTLVPVLWAEGIRRSAGRYVAITTGHCIVPDGWAAALMREIDLGAAGAGAGLLPREDARGLDCAIAFLRYGRYLVQTEGESRTVDDVPGDNAMYDGDSIREFVSRNPHGFWEIEYHEELLGSGRQLRAVPDATARFGHSFPLGTIFRHRFHHGRHCGAMRASDMGRARVVLPAPIVPAVLLARTARLAWPLPKLRGDLLRSIPTFLVLAGAWAAGEAVGALRGWNGQGD